MSSETSSAPASESTRPSSAGLFIVGIIAVVALAVAAYAVLTRKPTPATTSSSRITVSPVGVETRLASIEQRLAALERDRSKSATSVPDARSEGPARAAVPPVAPTAVPPSSTRAITNNTGTGHFDVMPNSELKGRLGRLMVEFPIGNELKARTETFKAGEGNGLRTDYGNVGVELTAGAYDLNIGGAMVSNVTIKSGHDTRVHVGILRLNATGNTRFELFPPGGTKSLGTYYGETDVGLPVGTYEVEVNGQRERVTIQSGDIAEF